MPLPSRLLCNPLLQIADTSHANASVWRLQKIRTVELDGKVIKLQIVSTAFWLAIGACRIPHCCTCLPTCVGSSVTLSCNLRAVGHSRAGAI